MTNYHWAEFDRRCNTQAAFAKKRNGTLTENDVIGCFDRPQCENYIEFKHKQCSIYFPEYCWCSTPDFNVIEGTFQKILDHNQRDNYCGKCFAEY